MISSISIKFKHFGLVAFPINIWVYICIPIFCEYWQEKIVENKKFVQGFDQYFFVKSKKPKT